MSSTRYRIKAYRLADGVTTLRYHANNPFEASQQAQQQGYQVIAVRREWELPLRVGSRRKFSVALFSQEILSLLEAGLSLVETLDILARKARHADAKKILENLLRQLREGLSFSKILEAQPDVFPTLYCATVRTSERTGDLVNALRRYLAYDRQINLLRNKVVAAAVYPALLIVAGLMVMLFLLGYVVPRFSRVYEDLHSDLPWLSQWLLRWGQTVDQYAWQLGIGSMLLLAAVIYGLTRAALRARVTRALWTLPVLGEQLRLYQLGRFTRTLAMLVEAGIPFVNALALVGDLLQPPALHQGLIAAAQSIREGRSVSDAFNRTGLATEVGVRLLAVGERSGEMGLALERIARIYEEETARWVDWFSRLFEPLLMIGIGSLIGLIVLLMYLPIFELASSIQ